MSESTEGAVFVSGIPDVEGRHFTGEVRWLQESVPPFAKRLQQRTNVTTYRLGQPVSMRVDWADVPTVSESDQ